MTPGKRQFSMLTSVFFNTVAETYLQDHLQEYSDQPNNWEMLLFNIQKEIEFRIGVDRETAVVYPHGAKIIKSIINNEDHTITILLIDLKTEYILRSTIKIEISGRQKLDTPKNTVISAKVSVKNRSGKMVFELEWDN